MYAALDAFLDLVYFFVLIAAALVLLLRLLAGTRPWARVLCRLGLYFTGLYLLLAAIFLLVGYGNSALRREYALPLGYVSVFSVLILLEFLALLVLHRRRPKPPPAP